MRTAPYFMAFGLLTIFHALRVMRLRWIHQVAMGDGGFKDLARMIRVFGNFIEYAPMGLILLMALEIAQAPPWYLHLCGATLLIGRIVHAQGLGASRLKIRFAGMVLTLLSVGLGAIGVTLWTFMGAT